jgi:hypothetical protein
MKRLALAGTFALIGGAAALLMLASILYSCRQGAATNYIIHFISRLFCLT